MSKEIMNFKTRSIKIKPVGTHNTIQPFSSQIKKGVDSEIWVHESRGIPNYPSIYVGGGTHGDELNGVAAILKLRKILENQKITGTVILVPQQSPAAFAFGERERETQSI